MRMSKKTMLLLMVLVLSLLPVLAFAAPAGDIGGMADNATRQFGSLGKALLAISFLSGLGVGLGAAFKFKAHSDNAQQVPLKTPIMYSIVAAILIGLPAFLIIGGNTLFGQGASQADANQGTYTTLQ